MSSTSNFTDILQALGYQDTDRDIPDDLVPFIGFLISKAAQSVVMQVDSELAEFGLTSRHYGIMLLLSRRAGMAQIEIGEKLQIDRTTMVKLVNDLEKHNLIERERDARDRRAYVISLSRDGGSLLPRISQRAVKAEKTSLAQLEQSEIKALFQILLKLL